MQHDNWRPGSELPEPGQDVLLVYEQEDGTPRPRESIGGVTMKPDKYGTMTEQKRYQVNWKRPSDIPWEDARRCQACRHHRSPNGRIRCDLHGFATSVRAGCSSFQEIG